MEEQKNIIIYNTPDGKAVVSLFVTDGSVWMNQSQLAELFATSVPNISTHTSNILEERELHANSVIKEYLTTASDGKQYKVSHYNLDMILAIGFRVRSRRGTQFRQWANRNLKAYMLKGFVMDDDRLKSAFVRRQIQKVAQGTKVLSISPSRLVGISLHLPSLLEQTRIANFLTTIDDKINHTDSQIQQTQEWKKGLLQKMFV